ncbi:RecE family exodeoxyribonuclease [Salmonella enterica]
MSIKQEEYSFYYKVKNESARKRLGFKAGFFWCTAKKQSLALSRGELAMDAAGFDEADFARPVRVHFPVENDIPPEGVFDTKFCENREPGGEDGKTLTLIPGAASAVKSDETELADSAGTPAGENGIQESHNPPANPQLTVVATLPFRHRVLAQYIGDGEYLYHVDTEQKKEIACLEMDTQNTTVQNLILAAENVEPFKKAIEHDIHKAVNAYKQVFPVDGKVPELCTTIKFFNEWFSAEHINRGLLVKEWAERLKNKPAPVKKTGPHKVIVADVNKPERPRRSEKPTHRTINYELACGFCEELDLNNLRPAMDFAKRIIAEDREDWKKMSMTVGIIPDIKGYDRQTIIDLVRKAPKAVHNGNPDLRRTWCESFLAVHGVRDPDWYEYVPDNTPTTHEENAARLRQAGKCLRDIEAGRFQCDEEKPQPTGKLADEPATPEAVEQDTTEHHPDPQPLENEPPVSQTEAGYQKIRAELHEARKNIPPKNPVDVGKQLAAARGEYVEGISDPNDPKWVKTDTQPQVSNLGNGMFSVDNLMSETASNEGEKTEVAEQETVTEDQAEQARETLNNMGYGVYATSQDTTDQQNENLSDKVEKIVQDADQLVDRVKREEQLPQASELVKSINEMQAGESDNLELWKDVFKTDERFTTAFSLNGGGTSINGTYMTMISTREFGPKGIGWGVDILEERFDNGAPITRTVKGTDGNNTWELIPDGVGGILTEKHHIIKIRLWYIRNGVRGEEISFGCTPYIYSSKHGLICDGEATKKSLTDATKKALSALGFCADIFMGLYDNQEYRQKNKAEFALKNASENAEDAARVRQELDDKLTRVANTLASAVSENEINKVYSSIAREAEVHRKDAEAKGDTQHARYLGGRLRRLTTIKDERIAELNKAQEKAE